MEFPQTGQNCSENTCKQLDFLPFICHNCNLTYCKEHVQPGAHCCNKFEDNYVTKKTKIITYKCDLCETKTPCEMLCIKCKKHFCLAHRHHGCLDLTTEEKQKDLEKWVKPRQDFNEAKKVAEEEVSKNLKKSKNKAMVNKVQLMRLKGRSVGHSGIPISERRYFLFYCPLKCVTEFDKSKAIYVSIQWSIGKIIDFTSTLLKISNTNNTTNTQKLRMFDYNSGMEISEKMDSKLSEFLDSGVLIDGQSIILEYSDSQTIDSSIYK